MPTVPVNLAPARSAGVRSLSGIQILFHLYEHGNTSPSNLARAAGVTPSAVTTAIDSLIAQALVFTFHPSKGDRRAKLVSLTQVGTELVHSICLYGYSPTPSNA